jgi:fermentation-respiration switch protein FrsA (DUF1100 family)
VKRGHLLLAMLAPLCLAAAPASLTGDWDGTITLPDGAALPLVLRMTKDGARVDSPSQHATGMPATVTRHDHAVTIVLMDGRAHFSGTLAPDRSAMDGFYVQGGVQAPAHFALRNACTVAPTPVHPQEPAPPFQYVVQEVSFLGADGVRLAGTLTRPPGGGKFPAVVLIGGSGPVTRDESVAGHRVFLVLADYLTRAGIAVLRYDKRGNGASAGNYADTKLATFAEDAQDAFTWLRGQSFVGKTGLIGHSEGAEIAPVIADHDPKVAFVVLLAPPALPGATLVVAQMQAMLRASGVKPDQLAANTALERQVLAAAQMDNPAAARAEVIKLLVAHGMDAPRAAAEASAATTPAYRSLLAADPTKALQALRAPTLALVGDKDLQVPSAQNLPALRGDLAANKAASIIVLPGLNHLLQPAKTGLPSEYGQIPVAIAPSALDRLTKWILATAKP